MILAKRLSTAQQILLKRLAEGSGSPGAAIEQPGGARKLALLGAWTNPAGWVNNPGWVNPAGVPDLRAATGSVGAWTNPAGWVNNPGWVNQARAPEAVRSVAALIMPPGSPKPAVR